MKQSASLFAFVTLFLLAFALPEAEARRCPTDRYGHTPCDCKSNIVVKTRRNLSVKSAGLQRQCEHLAKSERKKIKKKWKLNRFLAGRRHGCKFDRIKHVYKPRGPHTVSRCEYTYRCSWYTHKDCKTARVPTGPTKTYRGKYKWAYKGFKSASLSKACHNAKSAAIENLQKTKNCKVTYIRTKKLRSFRKSTAGYNKILCEIQYFAKCKGLRKGKICRCKK